MLLDIGIPILKRFISFSSRFYISRNVYTLLDNFCSKIRGLFDVLRGLLTIWPVSREIFPSQSKRINSTRFNFLEKLEKLLDRSMTSISEKCTFFNNEFHFGSFICFPWNAFPSECILFCFGIKHQIKYFKNQFAVKTCTLCNLYTQTRLQSMFTILGIQSFFPWKIATKLPSRSHRQKFFEGYFLVRDWFENFASENWRLK